MATAHDKRPKASTRGFRKGDRVRPTAEAIAALSWNALTPRTRATVLGRNGIPPKYPNLIRVQIDGRERVDTYADEWWKRAPAGERTRKGRR